jgi:hypothetical protein
MTMENQASGSVGCLFVAEYVDEAELPAPLAKRDSCAARGEVERPRVVASYFDFRAPQDTLKEFKVLLPNDRVAVVRGSGLKYVKGGAADCLGVWVRSQEEKVLIALFPIKDVLGIFCGDMQIVPGSR